MTLDEYVEYAEAWEPEHGMSVPDVPGDAAKLDWERAWDAYWNAIDRRNKEFGMGRYAKRVRKGRR